MSPTQLDTLLENREDYNLEFKEAKRRFSLKELHDYCAAISNEAGGHLLLGVKNDRTIVGTEEFDGTWNTLAHTLSEHLHIRVKVYEVLHKNGRVLVFDISRHSAGRPVKVTGGSGKYVYPIRDGECLVEMSADTYRAITQELQIDFSAQTVDGVGCQDLDQDALYDYRQRWATHTKNSEHLARSIHKCWLIWGCYVAASSHMQHCCCLEQTPCCAITFQTQRSCLSGVMMRAKSLTELDLRGALGLW